MAKSLYEMSKDELVAYLVQISPGEDSDALKLLLYQPLLERAIVQQSKLDGIRADNPNATQLPPLLPGQSLTNEEAENINKRFRKELKEKHSQQLKDMTVADTRNDNSKNGNNDNNNNNNNNNNNGNNNNNNNDDIDMMGPDLSQLTGKKRKFKNFAMDARDTLIGLSKNLDLNNENAVKNFQKISAAIYGNKKKRRRRGDSMVSYSEFSFYFFLISCIFVCLRLFLAQIFNVC